MTFFSHVDPNFEGVFSIQAVNEPLMDASRTPGLGQCRSTFIFTIVPILTLSHSPEGLCSDCPRG